jgi:hypothetical protein
MVLKNCGENGEFVVLGTGEKDGAAIMRPPVNSVNTEPSSDTIAMTVTPMERLKEACLPTQNGTAAIS